MDLGLVPELWRAAPRRWGHPLHRICSYFAMFPPQLPRVLIEWLSKEGDTVYDPFSGRGTAALEAVLAGRIAWAADANPLAVALSSAKVNIPSERSVTERLAALKIEFAQAGNQQDLSRQPDDIRMLYSPSTLRQLVFLKYSLSDTSIDTFIKATILGMLHANHSSTGATRGFSISMPNTFAMAPNYVRGYIAAKGLVAPDVDVFDMLTKRITTFGLPDQPVDGGRAWVGDATDRARCGDSGRAQLLVSSPPYLQVIKYGKYNWVRLWFLGQDSRSVDEKLTATASLTRYYDFMGRTLDAASGRLADDSIVALVIGDVRKGDNSLKLAELVEENVARPRGWRCLGIVVDDLPVGHKVSRIWKNNSGRATTTDRVLLLTKSAKRELPKLPAIEWSEDRMYRLKEPAT